MSLAAAADDLQRFWQLPFEFVDLTPEHARPTLAVVTDDGAVHLPSAARNMAETELGEPPPEEVDGPGRVFAYAVAARLPQRAQVVASAPWAQGPAEDFLRAQDARDAAWLLRFEAGAGAPARLVLRGPEPVRARDVVEGRAALLVDLGMVLTRFEREAFARHFFTFFGQSVPPLGQQRMRELRPLLESGEVLVDDFLEQMLEPLGLVGPDRPILARLWGSILSEKRSTVALVRRLARRPQTAVVVVSNTDPLCVRYVREDLGLADLLMNLAASCQDGVHPKGVDASLWQRGRAIAELRLGGPAARVIAVDDVRSFLRRAQQAGVADRYIHYRHFAQFRYELGAAGLYLPVSR